MSTIVTTPGVYTSMTRPVVPFLGMEIFELDTGQVKVYYGTTLGWRSRWEVAWGEVAYLEKLTTFTMSDPANPEDVPGMSMTWISLLNRLYVVEVGFQIRHSGAISSVLAQLWDETGVAIDSRIQSSSTPGSGQDTSTPKTFVTNAITGTGLSKTVKMRTVKSAGAGEITCSATTKAMMILRDAGPAAPPTLT